jgi:hypothetical protein
MGQEWVDFIDVVFKAAREFGFPTVVLAALGYWLHQVAKALHSTVVIPVVTAHTEFIASTQQTQERQATTLDAMASGRVEQTQILREISEGQRDIQRSIGELKGSR